MASFQRPGVSQRSPAVLVPSLSPTSFPPDILRAWIYQELADLDVQEQSISRRRAELKQLLNSSLPIHKLPNELLVHVFSDFRGVCGGQREGARTLFPAGWSCPLMLVCRHWRDVLVSTPAFWRRIDLGCRMEWTELCLSRSIPAAVEVVRRFHERLLCPLDILHPHVHRFRTFLLGMDQRTDLRTALPPLFGSGMPLLENLNFIVFGPSAPANCSNVDVYLTSEWFPCLRALLLSRTAIPVDIPLYAQLRTLTLRVCYPSVSFDEFLDALAASVQLEELTLYDTLVHLTPGEWMHGVPVPRRLPILLPHLRYFTLYEPGTIRTSRFLAHLRLKPFVELCITAASEESPDATLSISAMLPPDPSTVIPSLAIATKVSMTTTVGIYEVRYEYPNPTIIPGPARGFPNSPTLGLNLRHGPGPFTAQGLDDLVYTFARSPLTSLVIQGDRAYGTVAAWSKVFRTFPLLEELEVCGHPAAFDPAVVFRGLHATSSGPHADSTVACPNLKYVHPQGIGTVETYDAMRECFRWRGDRGVVLKVLDLEVLRDQGASVSDARRMLTEDLCGAVETIE